MRNITSQPQRKCSHSPRCVCGVLGSSVLALRSVCFLSSFWKIFMFLLSLLELPCDRIFSCQMEVQCEKSTTFNLQSIFNQVLKPLDVKTKFYNAEVSWWWFYKVHPSTVCSHICLHATVNRRAMLCYVQFLSVAHITCFISYFIS